MSTAGLPAIDRSAQQAYIWIEELQRSLDWDSRARAYKLLRAVLHGLRDHLPMSEVIDLGAQLPTLIRGVYYEQWQPTKTPLKDRHVIRFIQRIQQDFRASPIDDLPRAIAAVFALLAAKVSPGEIEDVRSALPKEIRALWDSADQASYAAARLLA